MSAQLQQLHQLIAQQVAVSEDMNEAQKGGGGKTIPAGRYLGRVVEYVDLGHQPQEYQGKAKDPAAEFQLGIALWGPGVQEDDGSPYVVRPYSMAVKRNEKSGTYKAFKVMNYTQNKDLKHFAQFLGQAFIFTVIAKPSQQNPNRTVLDLSQTLPPYDPVTGQPYPVPEVSDDLYRVFLWDYPTLDAWDALHIEGQREDGSSKNFIQEKILAATNFEGSALHQLLLQGNRSINRPAPQPAVAVPQAAVQPAAPQIAAPQAAGNPPWEVAPQQAPLGASAAPAASPAQAVQPPAQAAAPAVSAPSGTVQPPVNTATTASPSNAAPPVMPQFAPGGFAGIPNIPQVR